MLIDSKLIQYPCTFSTSPYQCPRTKIWKIRSEHLKKDTPRTNFSSTLVTLASPPLQKWRGIRDDDVDGMGKEVFIRWSPKPPPRFRLKPRFSSICRQAFAEEKKRFACLLHLLTLFVPGVFCMLAATSTTTGKSMFCCCCCCCFFVLVFFLVIGCIIQSAFVASSPTADTPCAIAHIRCCWDPNLACKLKKVLHFCKKNMLEKPRLVQK